MLRFQSLPFIALLLLAACTQTSPPHAADAASDKSGLKQLSSPAPSGSPSSSPGPMAPADVNDINATTDLSTPGVGKVVLSGTSAKLVYQLMSIVVNPEPSTQKTTRYLKAGKGFSCEETLSDYTCTFLFILSDGSVRELVSSDQLTSGIPEITQTSKVTNYLTIADPKVGPKVRVYLIKDAAQKIYDNLQVSDSVLNEDKVFEKGSQKNGQQVYCVRSKNKPTTQFPNPIFLYSCWFYLDVSQGSVDLVTDGLNLFK